jgi:molybdate transport system substrate-binding protein
MRAWRNGFLFLAVALATLAGRAGAAEVRVMISGGYAASLKTLGPAFERATGHTVTTIRGPSMGDTPEAIPNRLRRGEPVDVLIMVGSALDGLIAAGEATAATRVDLARSGIAMAVRAGAPRPDIGTVEALKRTLLDASSIAYSDSASGVYLSTTLFPRLGLAEQLRAKARMIPGEPVGEVVARGDAQIGFQQMSELKPVHGIDIVGPLPEGAQRLTVFSAAIAVRAREPAAARALLEFLAQPSSAATVSATGMEPVTAATR